MTERIIVVCAAFILDIIIGDPVFLCHPIRMIGSLIAYMENLLRHIFKYSDEREKDRNKKLFSGILLVIVVVLISVTVPFVILYIAYVIHPYLKIALEIIMCYFLLAMKSLKTESMKVYNAIEKGDTEGARKALSMIVGRDTKSLNNEGIIKAAVETVAENTSDGVIAPLFYILLFGAVGGFFYKTVNTMDSMIAYKNDKYIYFGRAAAYLDDILNFIPSRLSAFFMIFSAFILRLNYKNAFYIYKRDRHKHSSPNSAQTEAVCAGALSVALGGDAYYFGKLYKKSVIGDSIRPVEKEDIKRANALLYCTSFLVLFFGVLILAVLGV